jgi:molybdate transport system ATP-binding protein
MVLGEALVMDVERRYRGGPTVGARLEVPLDSSLVTVLFGESGSGKTTLLRCLGGLDRPDAGAIAFRGELWSDAASGAFLSPQARRAGFLFQEYALFPHLSVRRNIAHGLRGIGSAEQNRRVEEVAALVRVAGLLSRRPGELSGGQRQRVALARALAPRPRLLLLDEPLSALDGPTRAELRVELRRVIEEQRIPAVIVTHDRTEALALGDRVAVLAGGKVRQFGAVAEVFTAPADDAVARIVGTENVAFARILSREDGLATIAIGPTRLVALDPGGGETEAFACIRAEDVILEPAPGAETSARNELSGTVVAVAREGPLVRVVLECGFRLVALVTRHSAERLGLAPGSSASALVKAPAVRLVPRAP